MQELKIAKMGAGHQVTTLGASSFTAADDRLGLQPELFRLLLLSSREALFPKTPAVSSTHGIGCHTQWRRPAFPQRSTVPRWLRPGCWWLNSFWPPGCAAENHTQRPSQQTRHEVRWTGSSEWNNQRRCFSCALVALPPAKAGLQPKLRPSKPDQGHTSVE